MRATVIPPTIVIVAVRKLLRPLVRLLVSHGLQFPYLAEMLKSVYVEVAIRDFPAGAKEQTDSRINLLTGIHRKDVKRLRRELRAEAPPPPTVSLGAQLVARWTGLSQYLDRNGKPKSLQRLASDGGDLSFERLVESVSKDIRSRAVLDEWLRLGVATLDDEGRVCLVTDAFVPVQGQEEKAFYFGKNLHDHIAAAAHNLSGGTPAFMERSVYYGDLSSGSVKALSQLARDEGMRALQAVNRKAMELQAKDAAGEDTAHRMNFGAYFFSESDTEKGKS
jgi:hypothetical protein